MPEPRDYSRLTLEHQLGTYLIEIDPILERINRASIASFHAGKPATLADVRRVGMIKILLTVIDQAIQQAQQDRERESLNGGK